MRLRDLRPLGAPGAHQRRPLGARFLGQLGRRIQHGRVEGAPDKLGRVKRAHAAGKVGLRNMGFEDQAADEKRADQGRNHGRRPAEHRHSRGAPPAGVEKDRLIDHLMCALRPACRYRPMA
jgi:hypothetical protein